MLSVGGDVTYRVRQRAHVQGDSEAPVGLFLGGVVQLVVLCVWEKDRKKV